MTCSTEADRAALMHVIQSKPPGISLPDALWGASAVLLWQRLANQDPPTLETSR